MKIKIVDIFESEGILRIQTECDYGFDDIGLRPESKIRDSITGIPKWQLEVKKLLEKKYKNAKPIKEKSLKDYKDKELKI